MIRGPDGNGRLDVVRTTSAPPAHDELRPVRSRAASAGLVVALVVMAAGIVVPAATGWNVHVQWFPPLHARWMPRLGPGSLPALALATAALLAAPRLADRL